jgi:N-acetylmuramoyl-L-alanine amidase CwlA
MVALNYRKDHVQINQYSRPGDPLIQVQAIVVHYTANPYANAEDHQEYFDGADGGNYRYAGAHIFVDRFEAVETIPLNEVGYQANERKAGPLLSSLRASTSYYPGGNANLLTIGIEMCIEEDGSFHPDTIERTRIVIKRLQGQFPQLSDTKNRVVRHYDITGKICPKPFVDSPRAWNDFLDSIDKPVKTAAQIQDEKEAKRKAEAKKRRLEEIKRRKKQMAENKKATGFTDVDKDKYYAEAVKYLREQGILNGYPDGSFGVGKALTREEFAVALYRAIKK